MVWMRREAKAQPFVAGTIDRAESRNRRALGSWSRMRAGRFALLAVAVEGGWRGKCRVTRYAEGWDETRRIGSKGGGPGRKVAGGEWATRGSGGTRSCKSRGV